MAKLDVPRCVGCGAAEGASHFDPVGLACSCGHTFERAFGTGGEVEVLHVAWKALFDGRSWLDAYASADGRVVAGCPKCAGPVGLDPSSEVTLSCGTCGSATSVPVRDALLDALPTARLFGEPWGGRFDLSWTPELKSGGAEGVNCPSCGVALPDGEGRIDCGSCSTTVYATLACGRRFLPGVAVEGRQGKQGVRGWMPVATALDYYGRLLEFTAIRRRLTRQSFLGVGLLGILVLMGGVAMLVSSVVWGPKAGIGVFIGVGALMGGGMGALMLRLILGIGGAERRLGLKGPPPWVAE